MLIGGLTVIELVVPPSQQQGITRSSVLAFLQIAVATLTFTVLGYQWAVRCRRVMTRKKVVFQPLHIQTEMRGSEMRNLRVPLLE
jgi:hypothetical protein